MQDINSNSIRDLEKLIEEARRICIVTHMKPDGDALGSCIALYHFLCMNGKSAERQVPFLSGLPDRRNASSGSYGFSGEADGSRSADKRQ